MQVLAEHIERARTDLIGEVLVLGIIRGELSVDISLLAIFTGRSCHQASWTTETTHRPIHTH